MSRATRWAATITRCLRNALQGLADDIVERVGPMGYRVFVDSGPVLEKALARNAGIGWIGKHTNLIARDAGSYFFIGEILTDLPLPVDEPASAHCGTCSACIPACPTGAITAPYQLDARRCISYLTIELHGAIPVELRRLLGNRIYGCDDCQLVCPWNKFARAAAHPDFKTRHRLDASRLERTVRAGPRQEFLRTHRRLGHPPHRLRALAAQHRRGARQCAGHAPRTSPRSPRAATILPRWCANTWRGRWPNTRATAPGESPGSSWSSRRGADGAHPASRRQPGTELQVVDEPRLAEARRGQHHEVPRVGLRRRERCARRAR